MELNKACWLGGSARSGKSSIVKILATESQIKTIHADDYFGNVMAKNFIAQKEKYPNLWIMQNEMESVIIRKPLDEYIAIVMGTHKELFELIKDDIMSLSTSDMIIIEGFSLLPELLFDNGISNACYLISTQAFFVEETLFWDKVKTQQEKDNINSMTKMMRKHIEEKAKDYGYRIIPVDNVHTLEVNARLVAEYFKLPLPQPI